MNAVTADEVIYVPLSKLRVSEKNVRKKGELGIEQLAAQIQAEGLLQNLVVVASKGGVYDIVDGKRRFLALQHLSKGMLLDLDREVAVKIVDASHATSASLSAAFSQLPLHPVDQFDAFQALVDEGKSAAEVAAAFGIQERAVLQSLRLAGVARPIIEAYRNDEISLTALQAYTVSENQERQLTVFESNRGKYFHTEEIRATGIRNLLTEKEVADTDPRVAFVGREAYVRAGGNVRADLFSTNEYLTDAAILQRLANEKVAELKARVEAEGWSWVDVKLSGFQSWDYQARHPKIAATTPAQDKELASINGAEQAIHKRLQKLRGTEPDEAEAQAYSAWKTTWAEVEGERAALATRREAIDNDRRSWGKKTLAECGAVISLQGDRLVVHRGLMDKKTAKKLEQAKQKIVKEKAAKEKASLVPDQLYENLTAHRSAVIRRGLANRHHHQVTVAVLLHSMLPGAMGGRMMSYGLTSIEGIDTTDEHVDAGVNPGSFVSLMNVTVATEELKSDLPTGSVELLAYLLEQPLPALMEMLALAVANSFSAIHSANGHQAKELAPLTDLLVDRLDIDMREFWQPTADSYFKHVSKELIIQAVTEAKGEAAAKGLLTMSKDDAAAAAELHLENEEWLPEIFRRKADEAATPAPAKKAATKKAAVKKVAAKKAAKA